MSAFKVNIPCEKPGYVFSLPFFRSLMDLSAASPMEQSGRPPHAGQASVRNRLQVFGLVRLRERFDFLKPCMEPL